MLYLQNIKLTGMVIIKILIVFLVINMLVTYYATEDPMVISPMVPPSIDNL